MIEILRIQYFMPISANLFQFSISNGGCIVYSKLVVNKGYGWLNRKREIIETVRGKER